MSSYCFYDLNDEHLIFANAKAVEDAYETIAKKYPEFLKHSHEFWSPNHIETDDFESRKYKVYTPKKVSTFLREKV